FGVRRDGRRRGGACQCDFIVAVGDEVLLGRSHNGIRILRSLRSRRSTPAQCKEGRGENSRGLSSISHCSPLGRHREASFPFRFELSICLEVSQRTPARRWPRPSQCGRAWPAQRGCVWTRVFCQLWLWVSDFAVVAAGSGT